MQVVPQHANIVQVVSQHTNIVVEVVCGELKSLQVAYETSRGTENLQRMRE